MAELTKQDVVEIVSRVVGEKVAPIQNDLAAMRAGMVTKDELTRVRVILLSKMDDMECTFQEDLAAQDARLTVRLKNHIETVLECHDRKVMDVLRQSAA